MPLPSLSKQFRSLAPSNPLGEGLSVLAAVAVGAGFNLLLKRYWRRVYGHEAPVNPSQPGVKWVEALTWGLATGAAAGAAKVIARRGTDLARRHWRLAA